MAVDPRTRLHDRPSLKPLGLLLFVLAGAWVAALVLILVQIT